MDEPIVIKNNLAVLLNELEQGHLAAITPHVSDWLSNLAAKYAQMNLDQFSDTDKESLKLLIMICNILYNRTDMQLLPVEDGVYDLLMEIYKKFDSHFQVGSAVVQFQNKVDKELESYDKPKLVDPIYFLDKPEKDEIRDEYRQKLQSFSTPIDYNDLMAIQRARNFDGTVKISKRTHDTEHHHPDLVGTLDKCKFVFDNDAIEKDCYNKDNVAILERDFFVKHIQDGIITPDQDLEMVLELKYDGISVEADCTDHIISARTRGDTGIGEAADLTPILEGYEFPHNDILKDRVVGVKFEAIVTREDLELFKAERGYNYANGRTAIIGLFSNMDSRNFQKYISLVPLALDRKDVPEVHNREEEIGVLNRLYYSKGQQLRHVFIHGNYKTCLFLIKKFVEECKYARSNYFNFPIDGVVVSYTDETIRKKLGRKNFINKFSIAVKFDPAEKVTKFLGYTYEVGQTGNICPMIHYAPVEFNGTIHDKSSGQSLARFKELDLKYGDTILVTYVNDVMPYVNKMDCEANRINHKSGPSEPFITKCPICGTPLQISESGKSAICPNIHCEGRRIARAVNMLQKLNIKGYAGSLLDSAGLFTLKDMFNVNQEELADQIGTVNASNFVSAIKNLFETPTEDYKWLGSLGFTDIGIKKWKLIFNRLTLQEFQSAMSAIINDDGSINQDQKALFYTTYDLSIPGIGTKTWSTIFNEYLFYKDDIQEIIDKANVIDSKYHTVTGKSIRFTGFRNHDLEAKLQSVGFDADCDGSVTKKTDILLIPYDGYHSTKTAKVGPDTIVVPVGDFLNNMDKYL